MRTIIGLRLKRDRRGVSNIIVVVLSLVIIVVIVADVVLWSYQMNQLDWEKMREDVKIVDVTAEVAGTQFTFENRGPLTSHLVSLWIMGSINHQHYDIDIFINSGETLSYFRADIQLPDSQYSVKVVTERGNISVYPKEYTTSKPTYYLHRTDLSDVAPAGKLMNTTKPPSSQSETTYQISRGGEVYFYTPPLSEGAIGSETWNLHIWASTTSSGKTSKLTVEIHIVSSDGSTVKTTVGSITDVIVDYGYSERNVTISGDAVTIASGDRIRLRLLAQTGAENDPKGITFYYDGYGTCETLSHETRLRPP